MPTNTATQLAKQIETRILILRGQRIILDADLSALYGVTTKRLNEQVKRNNERFPADFMFQLTTVEKQEVVANCDHLSSLKFSRTNPYAFTEHGAIMAASVLNTAHAIEVSVLVVRTFVKLRQMLAAHKDLRHKLLELERKVDDHDGAIRNLITAIHQLMEAPTIPQKPPIGFAPWSEESENMTNEL
ncbi:MAG: ORF6N domain-containing protein [Gammaproteobacteria bacterium]|nr:ORF6N domain-containing protein [Gammaproteobacteria bacterium]